MRSEYRANERYTSRTIVPKLFSRFQDDGRILENVFLTTMQAGIYPEHTLKVSCDARVLLVRKVASLASAEDRDMPRTDRRSDHHVRSPRAGRKGQQSQTEFLAPFHSLLAVRQLKRSALVSSVSPGQFAAFGGAESKVAESQ